MSSLVTKYYIFQLPYSLQFTTTTTIMVGPTSSSSHFSSLFYDDENHYNLHMLTPDPSLTDTLNPNPNSTTYDDHHNHTYKSYSPTPTCYYNTLFSDYEDDHFSLVPFLSDELNLSSPPPLPPPRTPTCYYNTLLSDYEDDHFSLVPFLSEELNPSSPPPLPPPRTTVEEKKEDKAKMESPRPRKKRRKAGKTDRHSKIYTAQGARDRRVRLSVPIARMLFHLQDVLGFDKASKTIEWLFSKSKSAIKDLKIILPDVASSSKGSEVVTAVGTGEMKKGKKRSTRIGISKAGSSSSCGGGCLMMSDPMAARELRDKARARARKRTREKKKMMMGNGQEADQNEYNLLINNSRYSSSSSMFIDYQNPSAPSSSLQLQHGNDQSSIS